MISPMGTTQEGEKEGEAFAARRGAGISCLSLHITSHKPQRSTSNWCSLKSKANTHASHAGYPMGAGRQGTLQQWMSEM